jgi:protein-S-isoprenylcysteine O-methyltransferase Ste14
MLIGKFGDAYLRYIKRVPRVNLILGILGYMKRWER